MKSNGRFVGVIFPPDPAYGQELLGDAADLAEKIGGQVSVCTTRDDPDEHQQIFSHGADEILLLEGCNGGFNRRLSGLESWWHAKRPWIVFAAAGGDDRALAARLAARCDLKIASPALSAVARGGVIEVTGLSADGRRARQFVIAGEESVVVTLRLGVGQARPATAGRGRTVERLIVERPSESMSFVETRAADPTTTDIVHLPRLVAGGRGVGGKAGFELLRRVAHRLGAGVAASRMAVDLGWIERDRQVGQSGKTVRPELYIACGISGATHHRDGMSQSKHIVVLNTDPTAPIFEIADLGLVCDWRETMRRLLERIDAPSESKD